MKPTTRETFDAGLSLGQGLPPGVELRWDPPDGGFPTFYRVVLVACGVEIAEGCAIINGDGQEAALERLVYALAAPFVRQKLERP